jgi:hypothetical protein
MWFKQMLNSSEWKCISPVSIVYPQMDYVKEVNSGMKSISMRASQMKNSKVQKKNWEPTVNFFQEESRH